MGNEIAENNRKIAIYMGKLKWLLDPRYRVSNRWINQTLERLGYHYNYTSLMPVLDKIQAEGYIISVVGFGITCKCHIYNSKEGVVAYAESDKRSTAIYDAVVKFLSAKSNLTK